MRISTRHQSPCCEASSILKSVLENGLIGRYYEECGKYKGLLSKAEFLKEMNWSAYGCPDCESNLRPGIEGYNDYSLVCDHCPFIVKLADLIPRAPDTGSFFGKRPDLRGVLRDTRRAPCGRPSLRA
jgi:hypothetical protein